MCEKNAVKKRKPFDSMKQRVEGTDIAQFHQKSYLKKPEPVQEALKKTTKSTWKEKHIELLNSIRVAKGEYFQFHLLFYRFSFDKLAFSVNDFFSEKFTLNFFSISFLHSKKVRYFQN